MSALVSPPPPSSRVAPESEQPAAETSDAHAGIATVRAWLGRFEWLVVLLVAVLSVALHFRFVSHVGGIWRDEANSVHLSTLPSFAEVWRFLDYDSFPVLFFSVLRGWLGIFGAENDVALRALGFGIGLAVLATLWANSRALGARLPILSLALVGLNPMLIRYGDSTRAYGLGILLILLTFRSFWRLVDSPNRPSNGRVVTAAVLALLSVHCLYYNSVLLFAISAGTMAVAFRARAWRTIGIVLAIGVASAASMLVYLPIIRRMRAWTFMVSYPADLAWLWKRSGEVTGSPDPMIVWLWAGLVLGGVGFVAFLGGTRLRARGPNRALNSSNQPGIPNAVLFAAVTLGVGVVGYTAFLRALNYYTQPWYYITLAAFAACALDGVFGAWRVDEKRQTLSLSLRGFSVTAALFILCLAGLPAWEEMPTRHTNVDLIAARLRSVAETDDLILIPRWECAIPLGHYYRGPAEIVTIPPIADHRFHRYDLVLQEMNSSDPLKPVFAKLEETLRGGHRVYLVGGLPFPRPDVPPLKLPEGYRDPNGAWHGLSYGVIWQMQTAQFLRAHGTALEQMAVEIPGRARVQGFEKLGLSAVTGWR